MVRKSLLAKAISNHSESKSNLSIEDLSNLSSTSSMSSSSSLDCLASEDKSGKISRSRSLSHVNVSEFEASWKEEVCVNCQPKKANDSKSNTIQERSANQADASEMSLIDEDDDSQTNTNSNGNNNNNNNKRKASLSSERRSSLENCNKTAEKSKKFKSQVTSTPAAGIVASSKLTEAKCQAPVVSSVSDGMFFGRGKHSDGSFIRVIYQRRIVKLNEGENNATGFGDASTIGDEASNNNRLDSLICVWISRDPYSDKSMLDFSIDQSMVNFN